jgi:hypothetical protein
VYLYAANVTGYGGNGIAASTANSSVSLLTSSVLTNNPSNSGEDSNNNYFVTTDSMGNFTVGGDYTCSSGQQVYLYSVGGNPSAGVNSAAGLLAVLGNCPAAGNFATATPFIFMNEVSTVAAAYAFAGFATDATHVSSSGTPLALTGIANAFANAANLETLSTGVALATTPAANGSVPQTKIYTLGNILAACVNSTGPASTGCSTLFSNAMSGGTSGTVATDTATATINIAHNPGASIANLYGLQVATSPFPNELTSQPNDFTIGLSFTGGGLTGPNSIAIDASGNAWIADYGSSNISEFSSAGAALSAPPGYANGGLDNPNSIAMDGSGNAWTSSLSNSTISKFSNAGVSLFPSTGYPSGGLGYPLSIAIDGSGNAWVANDYTFPESVSELSSAGTALSPSNGYTGAGVEAPFSIAVDGSGNVWEADSGSTSVVEFIGVATPVITPICAGLPVTPTSNGSSNLGTRP